MIASRGSSSQCQRRPQQYLIVLRDVLPSRPAGLRAVGTVCPPWAVSWRRPLNTTRRRSVCFLRDARFEQTVEKQSITHRYSPRCRRRTSQVPAEISSGILFRIPAFTYSTQSRGDSGGATFPPAHPFDQRNPPPPPSLRERNMIFERNASDR